MPVAGLSAYGRSRAAGPVKAPGKTRSYSDSGGVAALEFAHLPKAVSHNADHFNVQPRAPSPLGARRNRLRKPAPAPTLSSRYYSDEPDIALAVTRGIGERPTRHSGRMKKAPPEFSPERDQFERAYEDRGRCASPSNGNERVAADDHLADPMNLERGPSRGSSRRTRAGSPAWGHGERGPGEDRQQRRMRRGPTKNENEQPESEHQLIHIFDSRHTDNQSCSGGDHAPRELVVGQRILGHLLGRKDKLRNVLRLMDATNTGRVGYPDFAEGLRAAGIMLGEADRRSVWADAGGPLAVCDTAPAGMRNKALDDRVPTGEVAIDAFMARLEHSADSQDWSKKKMHDAGYSSHMHSSLTKGLVVRDDVREFDVTGGGMHRKANHQQNHQQQADATPDPPIASGLARPHRCSVYLLYQYKSTNTHT